MTKKLKLAFAIITGALCVLGTTVYAAAPNVIVTKDTVTLSGRHSANTKGYYTVDLYDKETYTADNPLPSLVYRNQGTSDSAGWWNLNIPMDRNEFGVYKAATGDDAGGFSTVNVLYDGFDGKKKYVGAEIVSESEISLKSGAYMEFEFPRLVSDNVVKISYDVKMDSASQFYMRLTNRFNAAYSDKSQIFDTLIFKDDRTFGFFTNQNNWNMAPGQLNYAPSRTYHIDLWVDMFRHTIEGYLNGESFGKMPLNEGLERLAGGRLLCSAGSATVTNLQALELPAYGETVELGNTAPAYVSNPVYTDAKSAAKAGNIYFDPSDVSFDMSILSREAAARDYRVEYKFYDAETDKLVGSETSDITLAGNQKLAFAKNFDLTGFDRQYGLFKLKMTFTDKEDSDNSFDSVEFRFSVARESAELNSKMGIHTQFGHGYGFEDENMYLIKKAGISSVRDYVAESQYNESKGWTLPSSYTVWDGYAQEYKMSEVIHLTPFPTQSASLESQKVYAAALAKNSNAEYIELYNEINLSTNITPARYAEVLWEVAGAIKAAAPDKKVVAMAAARAGADAQTWIENVLKAMEQAGKTPADYIDAISVHPYKRFNLAPEVGTIRFYEQDGTLHEQIAGVRSVIDKYGLSGCPIIATELGWTANPKQSSWSYLDDTLTEHQQAEYTVRGSVLLYDDLEKMCWHTLNDKINQSDYEDNFGLTKARVGIEIPLEAKPAYLALSCFSSILANAEKIEENIRGNCYDAVFSKSGKRIHVLWTAESDMQNFILNTNTGAVRFYDMYGNESILQSGTGDYALTLSTSPVYVEELADYLELTLVNEAGEKVIDLSTAQVKAQVISTKVMSGNFYLFCAAYKDGRLLKASMKEISSRNETPISTELISVSDADTVQAFLWTSDLQVVSKSVVTNKTEG